MPSSAFLLYPGFGLATSKKYDSPGWSCSRFVSIIGVCKMQVEDIEGKLDSLIEMFREDREHRTQAQHASSHPFNDPQGQSECHKDKNQSRRSSAENLQVVVAKGLRSEPCTPILKNPDKPMLRNLSDLGPRVKKKVTYSHSTGCNPLTTKSCASADSSGHLPVQQNSLEALPTVFITQYHPPHQSVELSHQPYIVREEEEEGLVPRLTMNQLESGLPAETIQTSSWIKELNERTVPVEPGSPTTDSDEQTQPDYVQCTRDLTNGEDITLTNY